MLQIVFIFSLVIVTLMISVKTYEYEKKKQTFISNFLIRYDEPLEKKIEVVFTWIDDKRTKFVFMVTHELPRHTRYFFLLIKKEYEERSASIALNTRGTRTLKNEGIVSPYLKDLSDDKVVTGGGYIADGSASETEKK